MEALQSAIDAGQLDEAVELVETALRGDPAADGLRWQFFQLLCIHGAWERALGQLRVLARLDPEFLLQAQGFRQAILCESIRSEVCAGRRAPVVFGEPEPWVAQLTAALKASSEGRPADAAPLYDAALAAARPVPVQVDGQQVEWILDADTRFGPVLECIVEGRYYWAPFERIRRLRLPTPSRLIDIVWSRAEVVWTNGGESVAFVPTRYPGSEADPDPWIRLARVAEWDEPGADNHHGRGVRTLVTSGGDYLPLVQLRELEFAAGER